jgi:hypothetical protein
MQNLKNKPFEEVPGGEYDPYGFYYTPNGCFWDPDGIYFNCDGYDIHGGYYDDKLEYQPGPGWIPELLCYEDEKEGVLKQMKNQHLNPSMPHLAEIEDEDADEEGDDIEEIYEDIDYDKLMKEVEKKRNKDDPLNSTDNDNFFYDQNYVVEDKTINNKKNVYNPKKVAQSHINNIQNFENDLKFVNEKYLKNANNLNNEVKETQADKKESNLSNKETEREKANVVITPDMLFNKIPENLIPKNKEENYNKEKKKEGNLTKIETKIEVNILFG